ncbi:MAG: hypothetical protein IAE79_11625 [Anaerolinea sp.]|nr:hypothetical protein [Anaerolinea sp.]
MTEALLLRRILCSHPPATTAARTRVAWSATIAARGATHRSTSLPDGRLPPRQQPVHL